MIKLSVLSQYFIAGLVFLGFSSVMTPMRGSTITGFIPLYESQDDDTEVILLGVNNIVSVVPVYSDEKQKEDKTQYLSITTSDGKEHKIYEPYDEFKGRLRKVSN